jgi:hypothetical protein
VTSATWDQVPAASIVFVYGIGSIRRGVDVVHKTWLESLNAARARAGLMLIEPGETAMVDYRRVFRGAGGKGAGLDRVTVHDLDDVESAMIHSLWAVAVAGSSELEVRSGAKAGVPLTIQEKVNRLSGWGPFAECPPSQIPLSVRQVSLYLRHPNIREEVQRLVAETVTRTTSVVVAHSLGSVVAYEALAAHPEWSVRRLVTMGSPLGWAPQVFNRLTPLPTNGVGIWPGSVEEWTNVAFKGDIVAIRKELAPLFPHVDSAIRINDVPVVLRGAMHAVEAYLSTNEVATAVGHAAQGR